MWRSLLAVGIGIALLYSVQAYVDGRKLTPLGGSAVPSPATTATRQLVDSPAVDLQAASVADALSQAKRLGRPVPVTITLTEQQLTDAAAAHVPVSYAGASLKDPVVRLRNGQLSLDSVASLAFLRTTANVVTTPTVIAGRPSVRIDSATLAGRPVPDAARNALAANAASAIAADLPANLVVSSIAVGPGTLTVQGAANP